MSDAVIFLDANVLAQPVTRTLLIAGGRHEGLIIAWSTHAEAEAERHLPKQALSIAKLRAVLDFELSDSGLATDTMRTPSAGDRQILADAIAAGTSFLLTTDVDDYAHEDLAAAALSVVNPDYFMSLRFSKHAYRAGVRLLSQGSNRPPRTEVEDHRMLGRRHPRLTTRTASLYESVPYPADQDQPKEYFRGVRCVLCGELLTPQEQQSGIHAGH